MPDLHAGKSGTIGTTMTIHNKIVPNFVGVDIGCGMICVQIDIKKETIDFKKFDHMVRKNVPGGKRIRQTEHPNAQNVSFDKFLAPINEARGRHSIGILGGGNHFIELNEDSNGAIYLVIHSSSRNPGRKISDYDQQLAIKQLPTRSADEKLMKHTAYLDGESMENYLHDVGIAQQFSAINRQTMADVILENME